MAVPMLLMLLGLISMLGLVEVGYLYWAKREAQKVADLAALSGAQKLDGNGCPSGSEAWLAAAGNASDNNGTTGSASVTISCGGQPAPGSSILTPATADVAEAIKVVARREASPIWGKAWQSGMAVKAEAVATNSEPIAAFTVGSQLLELNGNGTLPGVLEWLGLDVDGTALVGPGGLANLRITPSGLLDALCHVNNGLCVDVTAITDVGTMNDVLAGQQVSVGDLIDAMAYLGGQQELGNAAVAALNSIKAQVQASGGQLIQLGTSANKRGLFGLVEAANARSALNAQVNALDLLSVGLEVANSGHFAELPILIPGVTGRVTLIEPPSIAVGGKGVTAYTAQLRVYLRIKTEAIAVLGPLLSALGTKIDIPLALDLVDGQGTMDSLCDTDDQGQQTAKIVTTAEILNLCIGDIGDSAIGSTSRSCETDLHDKDMVEVLDIPIISGQANIQGISRSGDLTLHQGETKSIHADLDLGDTVSSLMHGVLGILLNGGIPEDQAPAKLDIGKMVDDLWNSTPTSGSTALEQRRNRMKAISETLTPSVSPETASQLPGLVDLIGNLLNSVTDLLGNILGAVTGNGCTTTLLGIPGGTTAGCKLLLHQTLEKTQAASGGQPVSNALLAPLAQALDLLNPVLNRIGEDVLQPTVTQLLGTDIGRTDVHLQSLQCHGAQLVY